MKKPQEILFYVNKTNALENNFVKIEFNHDFPAPSLKMFMNGQMVAYFKDIEASKNGTYYSNVVTFTPTLQSVYNKFTEMSIWDMLLSPGKSSKRTLLRFEPNQIYADSL